MKKKSIMARLGIAAMALTMITTSLSSGTLAKYSTVITSSTSMTVAKWNVGAAVTAGGTTTWATDGTITMGSLYSTATAGKDGVAADKIAPGMKGGFKIDVTAAAKDSNNGYVASDVDADYAVYIMPTNTANSKGPATGNLPKNFTMKCGSETLKFDQAQATQQSKYNANYGFRLTDGTIKQGETSAKELNINWEWPYEPTKGSPANDASDTSYGQYTITKAYDTTFKITILFTQANPEPVSSTAE